MKRILRGILVLLVLTPNCIVHAGLIGLNISVSLTNASCDVSSGDATQSITLPDVSTQTLSGRDTYGGSTAFTVGLENCSNVAQVVTSFTPGVAATGYSNLIGLSSSATASGVAVQLLDSSGNPLDISQKQTQTFASASGNLTWSLRYYAISDTITAGTAPAVLYMDFAYQ